MIKFLRYNSRHRIYFPREGKFLELDPTCSRNYTKSGKRTLDLNEPLWLFRLRQRLFCFKGYHRCPNRNEDLDTSRQCGGDKEFPDTWDLGPDDNKTCSYCGSIHPDDLIKICNATLINDKYGIESTTKGYKYYIKQPNVQNASEGAIKFYMWHAPESPHLNDQLIFKEALRITTERFYKSIEEMRQKDKNAENI